MDHQIIREARLRVPFRPFRLSFNDGWTLVITKPSRLSIASNALVVVDDEDATRLMHPRDVAELAYVDEMSEKVG